MLWWGFFGWMLPYCGHVLLLLEAGNCGKGGSAGEDLAYSNYPVIET